MFTHILVPLDGSPCSERALNLAIPMAHMFDSEIALLCVVEGEAAASDSPTASPAQAKAYLDRMALMLARHELYKVSVQVAEGLAQEIVPAVAAKGYDLVVMNTEIVCDSFGRAGIMKRMLGSVASAVVRGTSVPLLLVSGDGSVARYVKPGFHFQRILVPLDGTELSEQALPAALALGQSSGCSLFLFMLRQPVAEAGQDNPADDVDASSRYLEDIATRYSGAGVRINFASRVGEPAMNISTTASALDCDLIVMATHGNVGVAGLGADKTSIAEQVVIKSSVPVLLLNG